MYDYANRNSMIINAIIKKAEIVCPGCLALIGIYGSFMTGDIHERSDLDLLIVINDDRGWKLSTCFIQDDIMVGHDIYCTTWESLRSDAEYHHPNISKLMDSKIVYCADDKYMAELESLRDKVRQHLSASLSDADIENAESMLKEASYYYMMAMTSKTDTDARKWAGATIYFAENALALLNKTYFHKGVRHSREELELLRYAPPNIALHEDDIYSSLSAWDIRHKLTSLMGSVKDCFGMARLDISFEEAPVTSRDLTGTYEEMYSNWRGKLHLAAETGNRHLCFMSLTSMDNMLGSILGNEKTPVYDVFQHYYPDDLQRTAEEIDHIFEYYLKMYYNSGIREKRYPDADDFVRDYLEDI